MSPQDVQRARRLVCERCSGEGEVRRSPRSRVWITCPECGGEGTAEDPGPIVEVEDPGDAGRGARR